MEQLSVRNLTFSYANQEGFALKDLSFSVAKGEMILVIGESGSGKTTLLRHLKPAFVPVGRRSRNYELLFEGRQMSELDPKEQVSKIGYVMQNVEQMQVSDKVWHEMAFGMENLGYSQETMQRRVAEMVTFFGLGHLYHKNLSDLSGGQKQLVNLASVMAMEPELLILDEPASQLDPIAATQFWGMIRRIHQELGTTMIITEHCLEEVLCLCDRVMVLDRGKLLFISEKRAAVDRLFREKHVMYEAMPIPAKLFLELGGKGDIPLTAAGGKTCMENVGWQPVGGRGKPAGLRAPSCKAQDGDGKALEADELWFRYARDTSDVLKGCSLALYPGKITAVLGGNGSGKSTLLKVLAGCLKPYGGRIKKGKGKIGILPQNPQAMFLKKTVSEELEEAEGRMPGQRDGRMEQTVRELGLAALLGQHPYDLSGGEMQRLGLAKLILQKKDILLLDEPGKGLDFAGKRQMGRIIRQLAGQGKTVLLVSHDVEFCAQFADLCGLFFDGNVVSLEDAKIFFRDNLFYTTTVQRMCRTVLPDAILPEDVTGSARGFGADKVLPEDAKEGRPYSYVKSDMLETSRKREEQGSAAEAAWKREEQGSAAETAKNTEEQNGRLDTGVRSEGQGDGESVINQGRDKTWMVIFFLVMPITIYIGDTVLQQGRYYFISLLLLLEGMFSFFRHFERRAPKLRELMVVAMLTAVAVAGRELFYMLPSAKPVAALVILSGVSFGGETGFLIGAMTMLVSNIFFGQGPWTPWQMFAMGLLGLLAGVIFKKEPGISRKKKWGICIFGFLSVIVVYGGIINLSSVFLYQDSMTPAMLFMAFTAGLPFDILHGSATFLFLMLGSGPLLGILSRVKEKYGFGLQ